MKQRLMIAGLLTFALIAQSISPHTRATQAAAAPIYMVIDLGTLGGSYSNAAGINNSGQVCGVSPLANGENRGFLYSNGVMTDVGTLGGRISFANGINNNDLVVGQAGITGNFAGHAFIYNSATGSMTDLGTLGGFNSQAIAINDAGQVVGDSWLTGNPLSPDGSRISHAFLYNGGSLTDLGVLSGDLFSSASGINSAGQVIGVSYNSSSQRPFLYSNGMMQDLNTLILPGPGWQITGATDINDAGQIVGGGTINGQQRAVLLTTPSQLIGNLVNLIQSFSIRPGIRILLLIELRAASAFANAGNVTRACNLLNSFINLVNAQSGRSISPTDASQLLAPARQAREALGCI